MGIKGLEQVIANLNSLDRNMVPNASAWAINRVARTAVTAATRKVAKETIAGDNAAEVSSGWAYSEEKTLTGKIGLPSAPIALTTTSLLHGVQLNWEFPAGTGDTQKTELQYSPNPNGNGAMVLSDVAYPGKTYQQMGLQIAAMFWYRARIVDRLGNESPWTAWVQGMASDDIGAYYDQLTDAIKDTEAWQEAQRDIEETHKELTKTADAIREEVAQQVTDINQIIDDSASEIRQQVDGQIETVNKSICD
ncbi:phage tail protein [Raoultella ornithinolytica]|nr:phage tail protein [Raoultella ornithinolytica]KAB8158758.1 hypothetical protein FNV36_11605 [Raoultella ornithinolytica]KAB8168412.1 hypothetical protein FNV35_13455 [Raoultella ornithinolytica]QWU11378.1 phage tail protein [Raoultella ornithinolytica]